MDFIFINHTMKLNNNQVASTFIARHNYIETSTTLKMTETNRPKKREGIDEDCCDEGTFQALLHELLLGSRHVTVD